MLIFGNIIAVAAAYTIRGYLLLPLNLYWLKKYGDIPIRAQVSSFRGIGMATVVMAVAVVGVKLILGDSVSQLVLLIVEIAVGVIVYLFALVILERALVRELVGFGMQVIPGSGRIATRLGIRVHLPSVTTPRPTTPCRTASTTTRARARC